MFNIILYQPQIAPNTGNIIRLVANNGSQLHLIEPLGFDLDEKKLRRAGLDYHHMARVKTYINFEAFLAQQGLQATQPNSSESIKSPALYAITTQGTQLHTAVNYQPGDYLLFGSETAGLPPALMLEIPPDQRLRIPMMNGSRSLNLSNAVAIVSYEAWRQNSFSCSSCMA